jgi:head-tail adaptor
MLTPQVREMMRRAAGKFFTDTCTIEREMTTRGAAGEPLHGWQIVAEDVPCRLISVGTQTTSNIGEAGSAETLQHEYRLIVERAHALTVDMRATVNGVTYYVVQVVTSLTDEVFHSSIVQRRD